MRRNAGTCRNASGNDVFPPRLADLARARGGQRDAAGGSCRGGRMTYSARPGAILKGADSETKRVDLEAGFACRRAKRLERNVVNGGEANMAFVELNR